MTALSDFTDEHRLTLISLPFIVGVYISHADDVDGEADDAREMQALERCVRDIEKAHEKQPFVAEVIRETLSHRDSWPQWEDKLFQAPKLATQAVQAILAVGTEVEARNYRAALMEIAGSVARAFGEFGEFDEEPESGFFSGLMGKITGKLLAFGENDADHPMNVSAAEGSALETLQKALRI